MMNQTLQLHNATLFLAGIPIFCKVLLRACALVQWIHLNFPTISLQELPADLFC